EDRRFDRDTTRVRAGVDETTAAAECRRHRRRFGDGCSGLPGDSAVVRGRDERHRTQDRARLTTSRAGRGRIVDRDDRRARRPAASDGEGGMSDATGQKPPRATRRPTGPKAAKTEAKQPTAPRQPKPPAPKLERGTVTPATWRDL